MLLKKLAMGLAMTCVCLVVVESILALFGVGRIGVTDDPYVGFAKHSPLFVKGSAPDGGVTMQTAPNKLRWFNAQTFPKRKPSAAYRIFCVGGSTTYGRPYEDATSFCGWLREFLAVADPSKQWDVVNAGGISYASYRVSALMEELADYQPDLFVVYSGHNEFLEERTYSTLVNTPKALLAGASLMSRTRIYAAMQGLLRSDIDAEPAAETTLSGEVDPVLERSVGPQSYVRDDPQREQIVRHYELNLHRMVQIARAAGADILFVMPASNFKDMSPFKSEDSPELAPADREAWVGALQSGKVLLRGEKSELALAYLNNAAALNPRHAETHYVLGQCLMRLGRHADARASFLRALVEDVCPLRMLPEMQDVLRRVCRRHGVTLVDFERLITEDCETQYGHNVLGAEHFFDHVHPRPAVHRMLALALVDHLAARRAGGSSLVLGDNALESVIERVEAGMDASAQGNALRNLAKVMSWAGKYDEAEISASQAMELLGEDSETLYLLGVVALSRDTTGIAETYFRRAIAADARNVDARNNLGSLLLAQDDVVGAVEQFRQAVRVDPDMMKAHYNLGNALSRQEDFAAAQRAYESALSLSKDNPLILVNLAYVLAKQKRLEEAVRCYRRVLEVDPGNAAAARNLQTILRMMEK